jgi:DNA-binding response OmpR family regulator
MRILVIEDNHRLNSSLASGLAHEGYSVDSAYDGQEGQDLAEMTAYDLIILDILLPRKVGLRSVVTCIGVGFRLRSFC